MPYNVVGIERTFPTIPHDGIPHCFILGPPPHTLPRRKYWYFSSFLGRILNRFSKDLGSIDEQLPKVLLDSGQIIIVVIGSIIVTVTVKWDFLIPVAVVTVLALGVRIVFLNTSQNVKRIEGVSKYLFASFLFKGACVVWLVPNCN